MLKLITVLFELCAVDGVGNLRETAGPSRRCSDAARIRHDVPAPQAESLGALDKSVHSSAPSNVNLEIEDRFRNMDLNLRVLSELRRATIDAASSTA